MTLGAGSVQGCTAAMHKGFKSVEDMIDGLGYWMDEKGYRTLDDFRAAAIPNVTDWQQLDMNYEIVARINQDLCIKCGRSEEHTSEIQSLMRIWYAVFCRKQNRGESRNSQHYTHINNTNIVCRIKNKTST